MSIKLPKQEDGKYYLSYSQIAMWKKSKTKRDYIRQYFFGEKEDNKGLIKYAEFGNKVGEALETGDFSGFTEKEQEFLKTIPRYDQFEREIHLDLGEFFTKGYIDTNSLLLIEEGGEKKELVEKLADYKTADIEKKVGDYESLDYLQTDIYAAAIYMETGHLPKEVSVIIIQRDGNAFAGEELTLGDRFHVVKRKINKTRVKQVIKEVKEIAKEISDHYKVFLKLNFVV